jgi:hypothetical protein
MFKHKLAFASLLVLSGCGASREALMALEHMHIAENNAQPGFSYKSISGWGNDITLNDVELKSDPMMAAMMAGAEGDEDAPPAVAPGTAPMPVARAKSMTLNGLTMKDGKPIVRDIRLHDITPAIPLPGTTVSLGTLGLIGMNELTGTFIAGAFAMDPANTPPAPEAWGFSKAEIGGLKVTGVIPQDEGQPGSVNVELGELSFADVAGWKMGQAKFAGLKGAMNVPGTPAIEGTFDFGTMTLSGIDAELVGKAAMAGYQSGMSGEPVDYTELYSKITSPIDGGVDRIDWTGMAANVSGLKFDTSPMHVKLTRNADGVATAYDFPRFNAKLTADASSGSLGAMGTMLLAMAGYESNVIDLYMGATATFDPAKDLTRWENYNVGVSDLFDVKISGGLIGLKQALPSLMNGLMAVTEMAESRLEAEVEEEDAEPPVAVDPEFDGDGADNDSAEDESDSAEVAPPEEDAEDEAEDDVFGGASPEMMMSLMMGILPLQLTDLDISVTDAKLVSMILGRQAIEAGQSPDVYRADIVAMLAASSVFLSDAGVDPAIASEISAAASGFMSGPGTLRIQLKPKAPLGVMSAMMPSALTKESLGFSATFTPAAPAVN